MEKFFNEVDSAILLHNASTQFADGGEFGMGAVCGTLWERLPIVPTSKSSSVRTRVVARVVTRERGVFRITRGHKCTMMMVPIPIKADAQEQVAMFSL